MGQLYHVAVTLLNDRADPIRSLTSAERSGSISPKGDAANPLETD